MAPLEATHLPEVDGVLRLGGSEALASPESIYFVGRSFATAGSLGWRSSFLGSLRPRAGLRTESVIRLQWSPNLLEDTHRAGGSQLRQGCCSGEGCRQHEKRKLPEAEPIFSGAIGVCPPAYPPETGV